jgi:hypothetical protein
MPCGSGETVSVRLVLLPVDVRRRAQARSVTFKRVSYCVRLAPQRRHLGLVWHQ